MGLIDYIKRKGVEFFVPEFFYPGAAEEVLSGIQRTGDFTIQKEDGVHSGPRKPRLNLTTAKGLRNAYDECSVVSTILSRLAAALVNGKLVIRDKHTKQENQYGYSKIINLLNKPNNYQTYSEFIADLDITRYLFGVAVVYAPKTIGMSTPEALHVIDPDKVTVIYKSSQTLSSVIDKVVDTIYIKVGNKEYEALPDEVFYYYDTVKYVLTVPTEPSRSVKEPIQYSSRLRPLKFEVENIIQAQEAIYSLNKDRGAQGILSNDKKDAAGYLALTPDEKDQLERAYKRKYGMGVDDDKIILTDAAIKWQPISLSVKDLMLFEGIKSNMCSIADAYNYPFELLANDKGSTFSNKEAAKKYLYQDNIIPASLRLAEFLQRVFKLRGNDEFYFDFGHLEVLQEANKDKAIALRSNAQAMHVLYQNGVITKEEFRRACGMEDKVFGDTYIDPALITSNNFSITNQAPAGTGYDNNDVNNYE